MSLWGTSLEPSEEDKGENNLTNLFRRILKIAAFVIDIIIVLILEFLIVFIFWMFGVSKSIIVGIEILSKIPILIAYFYFTPKKFGNTFGRKILKIEDKFDLFWTWSFLRNRDKFPASNLKQAEILKVIAIDGYWTCPSCKERNKELQDVCSNCGQEIER